MALPARLELAAGGAGLTARASRATCPRADPVAARRAGAERERDGRNTAAGRGGPLPADGDGEGRRRQARRRGAEPRAPRHRPAGARGGTAVARLPQNDDGGDADRGLGAGARGEPRRSFPIGLSRGGARAAAAARHPRLFARAS
jgi:hypothetical protein